MEQKRELAQFLFVIFKMDAELFGLEGGELATTRVKGDTTWILFDDRRYNRNYQFLKNWNIMF